MLTRPHLSPLILHKSIAIASLALPTTPAPPILKMSAEYAGRDPLDIAKEAERDLNDNTSGNRQRGSDSSEPCERLLGARK